MRQARPVVDKRKLSGGDRAMKIGDAVLVCHHAREPRKAKIVKESGPMHSDYKGDVWLVDLSDSRFLCAFNKASEAGKHFNYGNRAYWMEAIA